MTDTRTTAASLGGTTLLERAITYTLGSLHLVTSEALSRRTPCLGWDLRSLLVHMDDSLLAMNEALGLGRVELGHAGLAVHDGDRALEMIASLRSRACALLGTSAADGHDLISIGGRPLTPGIVTSAGAIEIAVHGWDVARACGRHRPISPSLAEELLELAPFFVTDADRPTRFAAPIDVPPLAAPGDRLVAFLGRHPYRAPGAP
ncbi:TIGR03086 family protein [Planosporangium flavigriseum]|uniref:Mycothiol-dependent maleylpyruvate isomerase metal-binding domain-containing protein n=1 Tax=Planosporangium flavigriseum TaxID=373681 RepID=A0A8J3LMZ5_9ACTN|nr:TIGR03086 family metal-binding protein [Planosporangium flavigriseum]NJC65816.1 TIGR03086 family protein [Planosporangium flavigriseum]GIG73670.1 hypothetical protein Pfl04_20740 [Planosporangium flavigriseum]